MAADARRRAGEVQAFYVARVLGDVQLRQQTAPGVAEQREFVGAEAFPQLLQILDVGRAAVVVVFEAAAPGAALVVGDHAPVGQQLGHVGEVVGHAGTAREHHDG